MPRTKPQEISPRSKSSVTWADVAGVDETKDELREVVEFLTDPKRFKQLGAHGAEGDPSARAAGNRQDAAGQGGRPRVRGAVLQPVGLLVRRDVRRPGRRADPAAVQAGARQRPGDHLHRRARRGRRPSRLRHLGRARPDAEPATGRDGRLRRPRQRHRDGGLEHAREARQGAAAPGPLRPPGVRAAAGHATAASRSSASTPAASRSPRTSTSSESHATRPGSPAPTSPTSPTRRRSWRGATSATSSPRRTSRTRSSASSRDCSRGR